VYDFIINDLYYSLAYRPLVKKTCIVDIPLKRSHWLSSCVVVWYTPTPWIVHSVIVTL